MKEEIEGYQLCRMWGNRVLIQVMNEEDVTKENAVRFKLAYSLPMLNLELSNDLRRVGEGRLFQRCAL